MLRLYLVKYVVTISPQINLGWKTFIHESRGDVEQRLGKQPNFFQSLVSLCHSGMAWGLVITVSELRSCTQMLFPIPKCVLSTKKWVGK